MFDSDQRYRHPLTWPSAAIASLVSTASSGVRRLHLNGSPTYLRPTGRNMRRPLACGFCDTQTALCMRSQSQEVITDARRARAAETHDRVCGYQLDSDGSADADSMGGAWVACESSLAI